GGVGEDLLAFGQQVLERGGGQRAAEQITLQLVATVFAQEVVVSFGFHAFGDHAAAEIVRHGQCGAHDRLVVRIAADVAHETLVDLDAAGRKTFDVVQRGLSGPEVVDRDAATQAAQRGQCFQQVRYRLHADALGDFQVERARI